MKKEPQIRLRINGSFLITVFYENYLNNDVKLEKIFLIDYFQNDLNMPVKAFLKVVAVS